MAGINQGRPETAVGEPIRFGDIDGFEIEQHPISDRLIIRDTANGKEAYVRAERGGQIGGDGVLIKALKESKPVADNGRVYETIQEAERQASAWVFVPPGTFNESVIINTEGLTLRGSGYNTHIDSSSLNSGSITVNVRDVNISNVRLSAGTHGIRFKASNAYVENVTVSQASRAFNTYSENKATGLTIVNCRTSNLDNKLLGGEIGETVILGCIVNGAVNPAVRINGDAPNCIVANNIIVNGDNNNIRIEGDGSIVSGNRVTGSDDIGIVVSGSNNIVANNRVSDSAGSDISDGGTGTVLDGNLTGASN